MYNLGNLVEQFLHTTYCFLFFLSTLGAFEIGSDPGVQASKIFGMLLPHSANVGLCFVSCLKIGIIKGLFKVTFDQQVILEIISVRRKWADHSRPFGPLS